MTEQIGYQNQHNNSNGQMPCSNIQNRNLPELNLPQNNGNIIIADMQSQLNMIHTSTHQQISELRADLFRVNHQLLTELRALSCSLEKFITLISPIFTESSLRNIVNTNAAHLGSPNQNVYFS
ncbi:hypothetical protein BpHYR1_018158 [Brachionus plicatilis]|uniref:Uncharacterized protein n=1 Tax=Brachionus plicatilis TaxID=10195 RepID=A0A3M7RT71_BRAPC|nr:hypothetical protein BpHYR1_018158 [Brachionus plicatilis]